MAKIPIFAQFWPKLGLGFFNTSRQHSKKVSENSESTQQIYLGAKKNSEDLKKLLCNMTKIWQYDQILRSNMTEICKANHTLWAVSVCLDAAAHVLRADESPLKESPAE